MPKLQYMVDDRDFHTTWLHLDDGNYLEVDPVKLLINAVEHNCEEDTSDLQAVIAQLNEMLNSLGG